MFALRLYVLFCSALSLTVCSSFDHDALPPQHMKEDTSKQQYRSLELFLKRSSVSTEEFEHFKILQHSLFTECGIFSNGRQTPLAQSIIKLSADERTQIMDMTSEIINLKRFKPHSYTPPEEEATFYSGGKYLLTIGTASSSYEIQTTLDSVAEPQSQHEKSLKTLATSLRALASDTLCGRKNFYGIHSQLR